MSDHRCVQNLKDPSIKMKDTAVQARARVKTPSSSATR